MSARSDRMTDEDGRAIARILRRVEARIAAQAERELAEQQRQDDGGGGRDEST